MEELWSDLRYGARILVGNLGFTITAVATLALGIGANTALFSVVNGVLLAPLHFPQADQLITVYEDRAQFRTASISYPNFLDWRRNNTCFASLSAFRPTDFSVTVHGKAERIKGEMISADFFHTMGVRPLLGRDLDARQDQLGGQPEVLISEGLWRRRFGSAEVLGKSLRLNGATYTIVGVVPASFHLTLMNFQENDVYIPIGQWNDPVFRMRNAGFGTDAIGRLKPGVTLAEARANLDSVAHELGRIYPADDSKVGITAIPLKEKMTGDVRPYLMVLLAAVFFVLLISCVNVANLLLARSMVRSREFAIRLAVGARQSRILRQLLTESVLLSILGGAVGLIVAAWGTPFALSLIPDGMMPRAEEIRIDGRVLAFTLAISLFSGILFGLAPAFKSIQSNLQKTLREGARGARGVRSRLQTVFAGIEMALAVVLLIGAGLMIRSLASLLSVDPGFRPNHVLLFQVALPASLKAAEPSAFRAELLRLHDEIASVPGVSSVSVLRGAVPMYGDNDDPFWIGGHPKPERESEMPWALWYEVEPDYFKVMEIPLKRGRLFTRQDVENSHLVTVIDETLAKNYFPREDPIGKTIIDEFLGKPAEIVGVVGHVKHWGLDDKLNLHAQFYIPLAQIPDSYIARADSIGVLVRTATPPLSMVTPIAAKVEQENSEEVVFDPHSYDYIVSRSVADRSFSMTLLGVFAAVALVLASVGVYGVVSYLVGQRTHEIGIRMALGAKRGDVLKLVLGAGASTALIGVAIGLVAAFGLTQLMSSVLYGVSATDPLTFVSVPVILTGIALAACYIPAWRAMHVNPVVALRYE